MEQKLFYQKTGTGPNLILIHGNSEDHTIFSEGIQILKKHYTVYAVDSPGHGQSYKVREYHYTEMAQAYINFIKENKIENPIIYGFSDGGIIALLIAIKEPKLLKSIAISGANLNPSGMKNWFLLPLKILYAIKKYSIVRLMVKEPNISTEDLQKIEIPTLVIFGQKDLVKNNHRKLIAENIKNSKLIILPKQSHGSYIVHSTIFANLLLENLNK